MEGLLSKTNLGWSISGWNERTFILNDETLFVKPPKKNSKPEFVLPLAEVTEVKFAPPASFGEGFIWASKQYFDVLQKQGKRTTTHNFYAPTKELADKWMTALQNGANQLATPSKETIPKEGETLKGTGFPPDRDDYTKEELRRSQIQHMNDFGQNMQHLDNLKVNLPKGPSRKLPSRNRKPKQEDVQPEAPAPVEEPAQPSAAPNMERILVDDVSFMSISEATSTSETVQGTQGSPSTPSKSSVPSKPLPQPQSEPSVPSKPLPQPQSRGSAPAPSKPVPKPQSEASSSAPPSKPLPQPQNETAPPSKPLPQPQSEPSIPSKPLPQPQSRGSAPAPSKPVPKPQSEASSSAPPSKPLPQPQNETPTASKPLPQPQNETAAPKGASQSVPPLKQQGSGSNLKSLKPTYPVPDFQNLKKNTEQQPQQSSPKKPMGALKPTYPIPQNLKPTQN